MFTKYSLHSLFAPVSVNRENTIPSFGKISIGGYIAKCWDGWRPRNELHLIVRPILRDNGVIVDVEKKIIVVLILRLSVL